MRINVDSSGDGKRLFIEIDDSQKDGIFIMVDTDDTPTHVCAYNSRKLLAILRDYWDHDYYVEMGPDLSPPPEGVDEDDFYDARYEAARAVLTTLIGS